MPSEAFRPLGDPGHVTGTADVVSFFPGRSGRTAAPAVRRVALISTYGPRKCGIATFTSDVVEKFARFHPEIKFDVYALDNPEAAPVIYGGIAGVISQDDEGDYLQAARAINESGVDAVWLQHEYGIFGGEDGAMVCDFVDRIAAPLVLTCHTVLNEPSPGQARVLRHLVSRASRIMVMSGHGKAVLESRYGADPATVELIAHGAPDRPFGRKEQAKAELGLTGRKVLMTFGLLSPGKGLERVIEALPALVARHPEVLYRIVGATHPNCLAFEGERYRDSLVALARQLGVEQHLAWENRFLETDELLDQLEACDIYVTPYGNLQQATSGTLSYAVALGKAVISTPYIHAAELLADDVGVLIEPGSSAAIAEAAGALLDKPERLAEMERRAYARGRQTIWSEFADAGAALVVQAAAPRSLPGAVHVPLTVLPGLTGVFAMSDATGMLQHGFGVVPDRRHGYCLDDNARALMLMNVAQGLSRDERLRWSTIYASFIQHAWNPELRRFRNFMRFERTWCEEAGSEDSNGRALWALGQTVELSPDPGLRRWAQVWFDEASPLFDELDWPRTQAFAMLGAAAMLRADPGHARARALLERGGALLHALLDAGRRPDWAWFEAMLGYDNPRLSQALIEAGSLLGREGWTRAGLETLAWIAERQTAAAGYFRPIGSETFGRAHDAMPFDQQPLEAQAAIEAARSAWEASGERRWIDHARTAHAWFFGANDRGVILADVTTGRSRDGVTPRGANENCGAESVLAFQLGHYSMLGLWGAARLAAEREGELLEQGSRSVGQSTANP